MKHAEWLATFPTKSNISFLRSHNKWGKKCDPKNWLRICVPVAWGLQHANTATKTTKDSQEVPVIGHKNAMNRQAREFQWQHDDIAFSVLANSKQSKVVIFQENSLQYSNLFVMFFLYLKATTRRGLSHMVAQRRSMAFVATVPKDRVPVNDGYHVLIDATGKANPILLAKVNNQFYTIHSICPHMKKSMENGKIFTDEGPDPILRCRIHNTCFNMRMGQCIKWVTGVLGYDNAILGNVAKASFCCRGKVLSVLYMPLSNPHLVQHSVSAEKSRIFQHIQLR